MNFIKFFLIKNYLARNNAFIWISNKKNFKPIKQIKTVDLSLIIGVDNQKETLLNNTINFSKGNSTNNALLWGSRGNGKSTLIKSVFVKLCKFNSNLKLIQLNKNDIFDIDHLYELLDRFTKFRFIIFIDDLSFEKIDSDYKIIKSITSY